MTRSISILQSRQIERGRIDASVNLPKNRSWDMAFREHIPALRFIISWMFFLFIQLTIAGFKGKVCSVGVDLCSLGPCGEHTLIRAETRTCGRYEEPFGRRHILAAFQVCFAMAIKWKLRPFSGLWGFFTPWCVYSQTRQEIDLTAPAENGLVYMSVNVYRLLSMKDPGDGTPLKRPDLLRNAAIPDNSHRRH